MSTLKADTIVASDGTSPVTLTKQSAAKAWINLNGTGTIAVEGSFNVTSATDLGVGEYTVTMVSSMSDNNYSVTGSTSPGSGAFAVFGHAAFATGSYKMYVSDGGSAGEDRDPVTSNLHGDLA